MGNSQTTEYSFQNQFYILEDSFPTDTFYKLQSKQTEQLFIGRQIQTLSKDDTYQLECILKQFQINPSPFCIKLLHATKIHQNAYCSNGNKFYLLFPWVNTLGNSMEGGARYSIREVDLMIGRVCKALKYIYGINHEHGFVSPYSVTYPSFCVIDKWALKGIGGGKGRDGYDSKDDKEGRKEKYAADLYAVGEIARSMMERVDSKKESGSEGSRCLEKIRVLMRDRIIERFDIYAVLDMKDQHRAKDIHQEYHNNHNNKPVIKPIQTHFMPPLTHNNLLSQPTNVNKTFHQSQVSRKNMAYQSHNVISIHPPSNFGSLETINYEQNKKNNKTSTETNVNPISRSNKNGQYSQTGNPEKGYKMIPNAGNSSQIFIPSPINKINAQFKYPTYSQITSPQFTKIDSLPKVSNSSFLTVQEHPIPLTPATIAKTSGFGMLSVEKEGDKQKSIEFMKDLNKISEVKDKFSQNLHDESNLFTPSDFYQKVRQQSTTPTTINASIFDSNNIQPPIKIINIPNPPISKTPIVHPTIAHTLNDHSSKQLIERININPSEEIANLQANNSPSPHSPPTPVKEPLLLKQQPQQTQQQQQETEQRQEYEIEQRIPIYERIPPVTVIPQLSQQSGGEEEDREFVVQEYQNGSRYEGYKFNGMRDGEGKFTYQQGSYYTGFWKKNNMHGFGRLYYPNQKLAYEGNWFVDQFHGNGKVYNDEPVEIEGYFDYTNFEQMGEKWLSYDGTLVCDSKEGYGKLMLSNGEYYVGNFQGDRVSGEGVFVALDKNVKGIWKDSRLVKIL